MSADVVDILTRARGRISDPAKWTQGGWRDGTEASDDECAVCAVGAVNWAVTGCPEFAYTSGIPARLALYRAIPDQNPMKWNDAPGRTHAEILAAFDKAIERAKAQSRAAAT